MRNILQGGAAVGAYFVSGVAFVTHANEWVAVISGICGAFLTFTIGLVNYAEYKAKMADVKAKEKKLEASSLKNP